MTTKDQLRTQIHAGRRQKLRARFLKDGLDTFNECEVLELALGMVIPRTDTNPAAHSLINTFGSLSAVLATAPADLQTAYGIGTNAAVFLNFLQQLTTYLAKSKLQRAKIRTPNEAIEYLRPLMRSYDVEQFVVVCLDNADRVKNIHALTNNALNKVYINLREIISFVTATKAAKVLVAHNHLNENPQPSVADMNLTRQLMAIFNNIEVGFLDHIIFAGERDYSFVCSGLMDIFRHETPRK